MGTLPVFVKLHLSLASPPPREGSQLLKLYFIPTYPKTLTTKPTRPVVSASIQPSFHPVLYKNSLFLGYRIQGDVGLPCDSGPLVNGVVEFVGVPKGDKGTQVYAMTLLRQIKWPRMLWSQGTPSSNSPVYFCIHFPHHSSY